MNTSLLASCSASLSIPAPLALGVLWAALLLPSPVSAQSLGYQYQGPMSSASPYASGGPAAYQAPAYKQPSYQPQPSYQQQQVHQSPYQQRGTAATKAAAPKQSYSTGAYDQMQPYAYPAGTEGQQPKRMPQGPSYEYAPKPVTTRRSVSQPAYNGNSLSQEVAELKASQRRLDRRVDALESHSVAGKSGSYVPSTPSGKYRQHVVEYGDSLQDLANRYGVTVAQIKAANRLDSNLLNEGDVLKIPGKGTSKNTETFVSTRGNGVHVVQRGESLSQIAGHYGLSSSALQKANGIRNPDLLVVGQKLVLPGRGGKGNTGSDTVRKSTIASSSTSKKSTDRYVNKSSSSSSSRPKSTTLFADTSPAAPSAGLGSGAIPAPTGARGITSYRVEPGDSIESVARMFGTSASEIQRKNKLPGAKLPAVGEEIVVPQPGSVSS